MDDKPLVSVVTPSYNQCEFIEETIRSVSQQNYTNIEHIIIDGKSTDDSINILEEYDEQIRWISETDDGQSDAINKGFDMAEGDIVAWLNSDDVFFDTNTLNRVVEYFQNYSEDIIYGDMALLNADSKVMKFQLVPNFDIDKLLLTCYIEQPSLFFRGNVVENEKLDTDLEYVMDYEFWLRLANKYQFRHVEDVLAGDRNHSQRKILHHREDMKREAAELRRRFNGPTGRARKKRLIKCYVTSSITRAIKSALTTTKMQYDTPELAFDGELAGYQEMIQNIIRPNRELL
jgi:glycosyltransferase involved in cell wall biosynthesis